MNRLTIMTCVSLCLLVGAAQALHLDLDGYSNVEPGSFIEVPINVGSMAGLNVLAYSIEVTYDAGAFAYDSMSTDSYDYGDWWVQDNLLASGLVRVVANAQPDPIEAAGTLFTLRFYVLEDAERGECYPFGFDDIVFNDGSVPISTTGASVCIAELPSQMISGHVYRMHTGCEDCEYSCDESALSGVTVQLWDMSCSPCEDGMFVAAMESDADGYFSFEVFDSAVYEVRVVPECYDGDLSDDGLEEGIQAYDLYMLRSYLLGAGVSLGNCQFTPWCLPVPVYPQMTAADTDHDDAITPMDGFGMWQVLQNVMDSGVTGLPVSPWCWVFMCDSREVVVDVDGPAPDAVSFHAVLPGDIDGSLGAARIATAKTTDATLVAPTIAGVDVTGRGEVFVEDVTNMRSAQFVLEYDPSVVVISNVALGDDVADCELMFNADNPGAFIVTVLSVNRAITMPACELVTFDAMLLHPELDGQRSDLTFSSHRINTAVPNVRNGYITNTVVSNDDMSWSELKSNFR